MFALPAFLLVDDSGMCAAYPSKQSENVLGEVLASSMLVSERAHDRNLVPFEVVTVLMHRHRGV